MRASLLCWGLALAVPFSLVSSLLVLPRGNLASAPAVPVVHRLAEDDKAVAGDEKLVEDVRKAIDEAVTFLKGQQNKTEGNWEVGGIPNAGSGGSTALVMLALLNAGVKPTDPVLQKGLAWLRANPARKTYAAGLQTMVFALAGEKVDRKRIDDNVALLLKVRMPGGWSYGEFGGIPDNSNTQYALLGLHEAIGAGSKVDPQVLLQIRNHFIKTQSRGGWGYSAGATTPYMNMTTAGLCNLIITGLDLAQGKAELRPDGSAVNCGEYKDNEPVAKALNWLGEFFPGSLDDQTALETFKHPYYGLYGIERAGRLTGQRYFGGHDWYEVGCRWLVKAQKADGSWGGEVRTLDHYPVVATSFALLFLSKGRTPVLISKLAYGDKDYMGWNNKRSDLKHVVDYVSRELFKKRPLAWQTFDVRNIDANDEAGRRQLAAQMLQSPIVFFNGHDYAPRGKEQEILKEYVANGGFILAENCCGAERFPNFDKDLRRLVGKLFPDSDAKLQKLEPEHPVWTASGKFATRPSAFPLWGVKQGCKTVLIYSPVPLAGYWEADLHKDGGRGQQAFELMANIVAYATGLEAPRPRLTPVTITADNPREPPKRGYLQVGQLRHEGDWHPAPRAMRNLMLEARKVGLDVVLKTQPVYPSDEAVLDYRFLYMHGRGSFTAKKEDLKHLRWNLKSGGLLLADACCGNRAFDESFRRFIGEVFADDKLKLEPIPVKDDLYSAELNGTAIERVRRRVRSDDGKKVEPEYRTLPPALEGVKYKGRWVVIYSKADIGCALEKRTSPDCLGHDPASALQLARAAVLYALKR